MKMADLWVFCIFTGLSFGDISNSVACTLCNKLFLSQVALDDHLIKCRRKNFICQVCGKRYWKNWDLKKHYQQVHGQMQMQGQQQMHGQPL